MTIEIAIGIEFLGLVNPGFDSDSDSDSDSDRHHFAEQDWDMLFSIPGREKVDIRHVVFDYNGTIAIDGQLIPGVAEWIDTLAADIHFHVITADTYGSVERQLAEVPCRVVKIPENNQDVSKRDYLRKLGRQNALCVGNGKNDRLMLKEAVLGIALIQAEGVCVETLQAADIACTSIMDVFAYFKTTDRLKATLRN